MVWCSLSLLVGRSFCHHRSSEVGVNVVAEGGVTHSCSGAPLVHGVAACAHTHMCLSCICIHGVVCTDSREDSVCGRSEKKCDGVMGYDEML